MNQIIYPDRISYQEADFSWMIGRSINDVSFFAPTLWRFSIGPAEHIAVECLWRIIGNGRMVRCAVDHGQQFGSPAPIDAAGEATTLLS